MAAIATHDLNPAVFFCFSYQLGWVQPSQWSPLHFTSLRSQDRVGPRGTRNSLTFVNTTAIAYTKILRLRSTFCPYAIAVVFTNVREIRVQVSYGTYRSVRYGRWKMGRTLPSKPTGSLPFCFLFFSSLSSKSEKADRVTNCPAKMKNTCNGNTIPWNVVAQCRFRFTEMLGIF